MKLFGIWTVLVALVISAVAAYYSIVGLVAIFAAAFTPIVIMGAALEVGKLTTAVWLHTYWHHAKWGMKLYLTFALVLLMFITSMGIFGFLSKAHIEQTAQATEGVAQLERIDSEIVRYQDIILRAEQKIAKLDNIDEDIDAGIQEKIDQEQIRIDTAYERMQPAIDEQKQTLDDNLKPYEAQLKDIEEKLALLQQYIDTNQIKQLQILVGARPDGQFGSGTANRVDEFRTTQNIERSNIIMITQKLRDASAVEISRLRAIAEQQIADSNKLISRLRDQLGRGEQVNTETDIQDQRTIIQDADKELEKLYEQKYAIEIENRKLEAEVGPVKYIAEFVYSDQADNNMLEEAVRWVILILVLVFDPLAVVLVIAGITLIERDFENKKSKQTDINFTDITKTSHVEIKESADSVSDDSVEDIVEDIVEDSIEDVAQETVEIKQQPLYTDNDIEELPEEYQQIFEDDQGQYYVDVHTGERRYVVNKEQQELNRKSREKKRDDERKKIEKVVERMKEEGRWPNSPIQVPTERDAIREVIDADTTGELSELLEKADEHTLEEVYREIIKDLNQKKEI
jgi:hypothetical protein